MGPTKKSQHSGINNPGGKIRPGWFLKPARAFFRRISKPDQVQIRSTMLEIMQQIG
jgi:hypothetical protein